MSSTAKHLSSSLFIFLTLRTCGISWPIPALKITEIQDPNPRGEAELCSWAARGGPKTEAGLSSHVCAC